jgi:hypothetical protein
MNKKIKILVGVIILGLITIVFTVGFALSKNPFWVYQMVATKMTQAVTNPPGSITKYTYNGQTVYYVSSGCCDQYNVVLDQQGQYLCAPDGGFTGRGDGKCVDFNDKATNHEVVWQDSRNGTSK